MGWAILIVSATLSGILPAPYDELTWAEPQRIRAEQLVKATRRELNDLERRWVSAKSDAERRKLEDRGHAIRDRLDQRLEALLTNQQRLQLAELRALWERGIEIGGGYFRSPRLAPAGRWRRPSGIFLDRYTELDAQRNQTFEETGIEFDVTNRSGQTLPRARFVAEAYDEPDGKRLDRVEFEVVDLPDGRTEHVRLEAPIGRADHHWEFRLLSAP